MIINSNKLTEKIYKGYAREQTIIIINNHQKNLKFLCCLPII